MNYSIYKLLINYTFFFSFKFVVMLIVGHHRFQGKYCICLLWAL